MTAKSDLQDLVGTLSGTSSDQITALTTLVTSIVAFEAADPAVPDTLTAVDALITQVAALDETESPINALTTFITAIVAAEGADETDLIQAWVNDITQLADLTDAQVALNTQILQSIITAIGYIDGSDPGGDSSYWTALMAPVNELMQTTDGLSASNPDEFDSTEWQPIYSTLAQIIGVVSAYAQQTPLPAEPPRPDFVNKILGDAYLPLNALLTQSTLTPV